MPEDVAAILIESVAGEGGYIVPPTRFMQNLRKLCDERGITLILDEIRSGMGRTGTMWAFEHFGIVPDIMVSARGLASGMPVSAIVARAGRPRYDLPRQRGGNRGLGGHLRRDQG